MQGDGYKEEDEAGDSVILDILSKQYHIRALISHNGSSIQS